MRYTLAAFLLLCASITQAEVKVLTSIKPIQLIAQEIQGQHGTTELLLPPGASPHSFSLRPSDRKRMAQADLFYWIGPDLEVFLQSLTRQYPNSSVELQSLPNLHLLYYADHQEHEHSHDGHDHAHHEHDHHHLPGALDSHLWLSTHNAKVIAERIAADLSRLDSAHAQHYQDNLAAFNQRLNSLAQEINQQLSPLRENSFFVFHEAFNYYEEEFGLQHGGILAISGDVQPGARHLQDMRQRLEQAGTTCILTEPPAPPKLAYSLSKDLPIHLQEADVLGTRASSYNELMRNLTQSMTQCLATAQ